MHRSSARARIVSALITLLAVPTALVALSAGGVHWMNAIQRPAPLSTVVAEALPPSVAWIALAVILLAIVGLLGVWSSAGLLACGVFAVAFTTPILIPAVAQNLPGVMSSVLPWPLWTAAAHGLAFGVWAVVTLVLTAMGVALALTRRRPVRSLPLAVVGTALSPVLLLAGMVLVVGGTTIGLAPEIGAGLVTPQFGPVGVVLIGAALIVLGVAIAAVAPYALLAPALIVITLTGLFLTGLPFDVVGPERIGGLPVFAATATLEGMLMIGAEPGLAVLFLSFTVAAAVVRRRAGGRTRRVAAV